jgi:hypothetical protein
VLAFQCGRIADLSGQANTRISPVPPLARLGRMKFHLDQSVVPGEPNLAQLMISHANHSGLAMLRLVAPIHAKSRLSFSLRPLRQRF